MLKIKFSIIRFIGACIVGTLGTATTFAQEEQKAEHIMITNVNVFDGFSESLQMNTNVLIENNYITDVGPSITLPEGARVIDGEGRTLTPGLIDMHTHSVFMTQKEPTATRMNGMRQGEGQWLLRR